MSNIDATTSDESQTGNETTMSGQPDPQAVATPAATQTGPEVNVEVKDPVDLNKALKEIQRLTAANGDLERRLSDTSQESKSFRQSRSQVGKEFEEYKQQSAKDLAAAEKRAEDLANEINALKRANVLAKYPDGTFSESARRILDSIDSIDMLSEAAAEFANTTNTGIGSRGLFYPNEGKNPQTRPSAMQQVASAIFNSEKR